LTACGLQVRYTLLGDFHLAGDEAGSGSGLDGKEFVGEEGLSRVVLGDKAASGGAETWKTDETDGARAAGLCEAVTTTDGDRTA